MVPQHELATDTNVNISAGRLPSSVNLQHNGGMINQRLSVTNHLCLQAFPF